jgi:hypothetical protein
MRLGLAVAVLCSCHLYDPVDEIDYREYPDTKSAVSAILAEAGDVRVYAVGEYHPTRAGVAKRSPLARFTGEIIDLLAPHARHLIVEAWLDDGCQSSGQAIGSQVAAATGRPPSTGAELAVLIATGKQNKVETHGLPMTCIEHGSLLDARGRVDFLRLLELVTEKLGDTARALVAQDKPVIVYGGALHNDLFPRWPLAELSYAESLSKDLNGRVLELDLVVPEVVAPMALVRAEAWFPLLGRASPDRVLVWERGPMSYVVILPAESELVARVALPIDVM